MNLKEKMQNLDTRICALKNTFNQITESSFLVKQTLLEFDERVRELEQSESESPLKTPFWVLITINDLEKRIEALENACKHNYTFDWVYTYIGDK